MPAPVIAPEFDRFSHAIIPRRFTHPSDISRIKVNISLEEGTFKPVVSSDVGNADNGQDWSYIAQDMAEAAAVAESFLAHAAAVVEFRWAHDTGLCPRCGQAMDRGAGKPDAQCSDKFACGWAPKVAIQKEHAERGF